MSKPEQAVRTAAQALHLAITDAKSHGLVIAWPRRASELPQIAISEAAKSAKREEATKPSVRAKPASNASK